MKTQNSFKRMVAILVTFFAIVSTASADWLLYDCSEDPLAAGFSASSSNTSANNETASPIADVDIPGNSVLDFQTIDVTSSKLSFSKSFSGDLVDGVTLVLRAKALSVDHDMIEFYMKSGSNYEKFRFYADKEVLNQEKGWGTESGVDKKVDYAMPAGTSMLDWNIYRFTMIDSTINVWVNDVQIATDIKSTNEDTETTNFGFGDGNGSSTYSCLVDWIITDETGAYAPGAGSDYPSDIIISPLSDDSEPVVNNWVIYDGSQTASDYGFGASSSNTTTTGDIHAVVTDPDDAANSLLQLSTVAGKSSKDSWSQSVDIDSTLGFTVAMRAKGLAADDSTDVVELYLKSGMYYEKIRIYSDGNLNLEKGNDEGTKVNYPVPETVSLLDWNIYRVTIVGDLINIWVNENHVVHDVLTTNSATSTTNFGFGDGNTGSCYSAYIDWIIWDVTAAYDYGSGPDYPLTVDISPLTRGEVVIPDFLTFASSNTDISSAATTITDLELQSNTAWSLFADQDDTWITSVTPAGGDSGVHTFSVVVEENTGAAPRIGTVYGVIGSEILDSYTITQDGQAVKIDALDASSSSMQDKSGVIKYPSFAIDGYDSTAWVAVDKIVNGTNEWLKVAVDPGSEVVMVKVMEYKNDERHTVFSVDYWNGTEYAEALSTQISPLQSVANSEVAYSFPTSVVTDTIMFKFYGNVSADVTDASLAEGWLTISEVSVWGAAAATAVVTTDDVEFMVYPNPSTGVFMIDNAAGADVRVISLSGQVLFEKSNISSQEQLDLNLPSGLYLLDVDDTLSKIMIK